MTSPFMSPEYLGEQQALHAAPRGYGAKGSRWAPLVENIALQQNAWSILDYGCGQGSLGRALAAKLPAVRIDGYDPAVAAFQALPYPADLVCCTDVLEHVEPGYVADVVDHLAALTTHALFVAISTVPTSKILSDGRQAHISLHPREWWRSTLARRFGLIEEFEIKPAKQMVAVYAPGGS